MSTSASAAVAAASTEAPKPPVVKKIPRTVYFGQPPEGHPDAELERCPEGEEDQLIDPPIEHVDDLFWLRDDERKNPEVLAILEQENAYADYHVYADGGKELAEELYKEHIGHIKETDDSVPVRHPAGPDGRSYFYFTKTIQGKSYPIHCRRPTTSNDDADVETLLDINVLAEGRSQCDVHEFEPSPRHDVIAYSLDVVGDECYTIFFYAPGNEALTKKLEAKQIKNATGGFSWLPDASGVVYTTRDEAKRSDKVWLHDMDDAATGGDLLLLHEPNSLFSVDEGVTRDDAHLFVVSGSSEEDEYRFFRLQAPCVDSGNNALSMAKRIKAEGLQLLRKREPKVRAQVTSHGDGNFFVLTNCDGAMSQKVINVRCDPLSKLTPVPDFRDKASSAVRTVVPHNPAITYEAVQCLKGCLIVEGRAEGLTQIWTMAVKSFGEDAPLVQMKQPEPIYEVVVLDSHMRDFSSSTMRITFSSMTTPQTWLDVDVSDHSKRTVIKQKEVPQFEPSKYAVERMWATAPDGVQIPMSVLRLKTTTLNTGAEDGADSTPPRPCLLYGYGSYGLCVDPRFTISPLPLVDRGVVYVIAHIRGGGEMGRDWYERYGKYLTKRNTFSDFIACAEHLIAKKVTSPGQLGIEGRSAGGLLMGAVCNMRPDLFRCCLNGVGFSDVIVTMQDASIPLTTGEWAEWGNPSQAAYLAYMRSYDPMQNVVAQRYPNTLFTAGLHDPRVLYSEPLKLLTRVREKHVDKPGEPARQILGKFDTKAGHFSANDRYKLWREKAYEQAFMLKHMIPGIRATAKNDAVNAAQ